MWAEEPADSAVVWPADSVIEIPVDSVLMARTDSLMRAQADSIAKAQADSIAKAKADSIAKAKADSIARAQAVPKWQTCMVRGAQAHVTMGKQSLSTACNMQAIWDSVVIISVTPVFGMEMYRLEATPKEVIVIDKVKKEYVRMTYTEINRLVTPRVTYRDLQAIASGEKPTSARNGIITYSANGQSASLQVVYPMPVKNKSISIVRTELKKYKKIDIYKFL